MQYVKVVDLLNLEDEWNWNNLAYWLSANMLNQITYILPPHENHVPNVRAGFADGSKDFAVPNMHIILNDTQNALIDSQWKKLWKMRVPNRVHFFIWQLWYDKILTNMNKSNMALGSPMRRLCRNIEEDSLHIFRDFPLVMPVWMSTIHVKWRNTLFSNDLKQWLIANMNNNLRWKKGGDCKAFWEVSCHSIWNW